MTSYGCGDISQLEWSLHSAINDIRVEHGQSTLPMGRWAYATARLHADDNQLAEYNYKTTKDPVYYGPINEMGGDYCQSAPNDPTSILSLHSWRGSSDDYSSCCYSNWHECMKTKVHKVSGGIISDKETAWEIPIGYLPNSDEAVECMNGGLADFTTFDSEAILNVIRSDNAYIDTINSNGFPEWKAMSVSVRNCFVSIWLLTLDGDELCPSPYQTSENADASDGPVLGSRVYGCEDIEEQDWALHRVLNKYLVSIGKKPAAMGRYNFAKGKLHGVDNVYAHWMYVSTGDSKYGGDADPQYCTDKAINNMHSWYGKGELWNSCCYLPDHTNGQCESAKLSEISNGLLKDYVSAENASGYGFTGLYFDECVASDDGSVYDMRKRDAETQLNEWLDSPGHRATIDSTRGWPDWSTISVSVNKCLATMQFMDKLEDEVCVDPLDTSSCVPAISYAVATSILATLLL